MEQGGGATASSAVVSSAVLSSAIVSRRRRRARARLALTSNLTVTVRPSPTLTLTLTPILTLTLTPTPTLTLTQNRKPNVRGATCYHRLYGRYRRELLRLRRGGLACARVPAGRRPVQLQHVRLGRLRP